jgi:hypothetical protein
MAHVLRQHSAHICEKQRLDSILPTIRLKYHLPVEKLVIGFPFQARGIPNKHFIQSFSPASAYLGREKRCL